MSFEEQLSEIFDITVWELKPRYRDDDALDEIQLNTSQNVVGESAKLLYSNHIKSEKFIRLYIKTDEFFNFFVKVSEVMFFKSFVEIYMINDELELEQDNKYINLIIENFLDIKLSITSKQNKENIFKKLYEFSDFSS